MSAWTVDQVLALAPDAAAAMAGSGLAKPAKWLILGRCEKTVWGECQGSGRRPYQTQIDLSEPAFKCSCPSRKFPCKHALGLFLLLAEQPGAVPQGEPPPWAAEWLEKRAQRASRRIVPAAADPADRLKKDKDKARRAAQRQARVEAGLAELERWLRDLIRQGLAGVQNQPARFWDRMAARMIDAQAPGVARRLREMAGISGEGWAEQLLARLGLLHLLLEGFKRIEILPVSLQADVRTAIGWTWREEDLAGKKGVRDRWRVLGQRVYEEDRLQVQRTWLRGEACKKNATVLDFAAPGKPLDGRLAPGTALEAELVFYPGAYPLRASIRKRLGPPATMADPPALPDTASLLAAYADALARQPWLEVFPAALAAVTPLRRDGAWLARDVDGHGLPLSPQFQQTWRLLALSGGHPLTLFGEWDGQHLLPLSAWLEGRFVRF